MGLFKDFYLNESSEISKAAKVWGLKHIDFNHYKDPRTNIVWTWNKELKKFEKNDKYEEESTEKKDVYHGEIYQRMGKHAYKIFKDEKFLGNSQLSWDSSDEANKAMRKYIKQQRDLSNKNESLEESKKKSIKNVESLEKAKQLLKDNGLNYKECVKSQFDDNIIKFIGVGSLKTVAMYYVKEKSLSISG